MSARAIVATAFTPSLDSGRGRRTYAIVRALAAHGPVAIAYARFGAAEPDPAYAAAAGVTLHGADASRGARRALAFARARLSGVPTGFARGIWPELLDAVNELAPQQGERVIADGPIAAATLAPLAALRPVIYNAHNLESAFRHELGQSGLDSQKSLREFERRVLERSSESWMVSEADIEGASALAPSARLRLVPNCVDVGAIEPLPPRDGQRSAAFVADFSYPPNRNAFGFLVERVMPAVWASAPDVRLLVVGRGAPAVADERVEVLGWVDDLRAVYDRAGCAAVPLLEGGGSPLKFVEALAYRLPVVATPRAAAGLAVAAGEHYFEGEPRPEPFAAALVAALASTAANRVAAAGRELAEREYSIEALARSVAP